MLGKDTTSLIAVVVYPPAAHHALITDLLNDNEFISESSGLYQMLFSLGEHMNIIPRLRLGTIYYMCSPRGNNL